MEHKIFEVGGCVRDEILGVHTKDIDFTFVLDNTDMTVEEGWSKMLSILESDGFKIFLKTPDCFTVRAMFPKGHEHEGLVADFVMSRKEVGVIPGTRKPILELGTLEDDLMRRDFTLNSLCKDENGNIWFGTKKGISILNSKNNSWKHIKNLSNTNNDEDVIVLALEPDGNFMWAGTYNEGLFKININTLREIHYNSEVSEGIIEKVYAIHKDSKK